MRDKPKKLSDTACALLTAAALRNDHFIALPKLPVAAARQAVRSLLNAGFANEVPAPMNDPGYAWRTGRDGGVLALRATALGITRALGGDGDYEAGYSAGTTKVQADDSAVIAAPFAVDPLTDAIPVIAPAEEGGADPNRHVKCRLLRCPPRRLRSPVSRPGLPSVRTSSVGLRRPCSTPGTGWRAAAPTLTRSSALSQPFAPRRQQALQRTDRSTARVCGRTRSKRRSSPCCAVTKAPAGRKSQKPWAGPHTPSAAFSQASPRGASRLKSSTASARSDPTRPAPRAATRFTGWSRRLRVR
jgi:hypothetical protein